MKGQDETDTRILIAPEGTPLEKLQEAARHFLSLRRSGNYHVTEAWLRQAFKDADLTIQGTGTTEEELQRFLKEDCRRQVEQDLQNWRTTNSIGYPEACFAKGVLEHLQKGDLRSEDFEITPEELDAIRTTAGL